MYMASMDIQMAFHVGKTEAYRRTSGRTQDARGWITAAVLREMEALEGHGTSEEVESRFNLTRCICQACVEAPTLRLELTKHFLWNVENEWKRKQMGSMLAKVKVVASDMQFSVGRQLLGHVALENQLPQIMKELIEEAGRWNLEPKLAILWVPAHVRMRSRRTRR